MSKPRPIAPIVEIVERNTRVRRDYDGPIAPNDVRINGVSVLCADEPVVVERIEAGGGDLVQVTVTLLARRVMIDLDTEETNA